MCDERQTRTHRILLRLDVTRRRVAVAAVTTVVAVTAVGSAVAAVTAVVIIIVTVLPAVAVAAEVLSGHAEFPIVVSPPLAAPLAPLAVSPAPLVVPRALVVSPARVPSVAVPAAAGLRRRVIVVHRPVAAVRGHVAALFRQVDKLSLPARMVRRPALQAL